MRNAKGTNMLMCNAKEASMRMRNAKGANMFMCNAKDTNMLMCNIKGANMLMRNTKEMNTRTQKRARCSADAPMCRSIRPTLCRCQTHITVTCLPQPPT